MVLSSDTFNFVFFFYKCCENWNLCSPYEAPRGSEEGLGDFWWLRDLENVQRWP